MQAIFAIDLHQHAVLFHGGDETGELLPQVGAAGDEIFTEQVGQVFRFGAHAEVRAVLAGELVDKENEGAHPAA